MKRGMTLAEVLVVGALLTLLGGVVVAVLQPGLSAWRRSEVRGELQGNALRSLHALVRALEQARSRDVEIVSHTHAAPDDGSEPDDAIVIGDAASVRIFYLRTETHELWQARLEATGDERVPAAVRAALEEGRGVPPHYGEQRRLARCVHLLGADRTAGPFTLRVETREGSLRCEVRGAVTPILESLGELPAGAGR